MLSELWPQGTGRIVLDSIDSTNAEAFRRAPHLSGPAWILAASQSAGRGRRARPWASPLGNFYGTLIYQPQGSPQELGLRSFLAALSLYDAFASVAGTEAGLALKWPNDVLMNGGKVAGILLESQTLGPAGRFLAIGIGVNLIGHPPVEAVEPGAVTPVSVLGELGVRVSPTDFLTALAAAFAKWEAIMAAEGFGPIRTAWLARAARLGEQIRARTGQEERHGLFETIDAEGNLVLRLAGGTVVAIPAAEVFF